MRFYFLILISIFIISTIAVITANSITGNISVIPGCPSRCTYFPFETQEDLTRIQNRISENFFIYDTFNAPGYGTEGEYVICACPRN